MTESYVATAPFLKGEWDVVNRSLTVYGGLTVELSQQTIDGNFAHVFVPAELVTITRRLPPEPPPGTAVWVKEVEQDRLYYRLPHDIAERLDAGAAPWVHYGPCGEGGLCDQVHYTTWEKIGRDSRPITNPLEDMVAKARRIE